MMMASRLVPVLGLLVLAPCIRAATPAAAPVTIEGVPRIDLTKTDGGLAPVPGAQNYQVFRSSHARPDLVEGKGYTYNHHPDLAVWHGRFYVAWDSGAKDEDTWPARELYSTSANGMDWSAPTALFPEGTSTPTRLYFFHAPNGRMLAFAGMRVSHEKTDEDTKGPIVVREITADHSLGSVYTLRPPAQGAPADAPAPFTTARDAGFVEACRQLLAARVTLETQDLGVFLDPDQRIRWHNASAWPNGKVGNGFWKAPSFYHRQDGAIVGIGKNGWTSVSTDNGATWSQPVVPPTLKTNNAKVWGQRTGDGRYALVYNPTARPRYPLAIVSSDDGITFGDMRVVQPRFTTQRYPGINKNPGLQYIRGIAEWASDGSIADATQALWIAYSANKEDIWVSRVPLPLDRPAESRWNVYRPKWSTVTVNGADGVSLETREPFDCAEAFRFFTPAAEVAVSFTITTPPAGFGAVDVALLGSASDARPVQLRFAGDGMVRAYDRDKMVEYGHYPPGTKLAVRVEARSSARGIFSVFLDGRKVDDAQFAEHADALDRISVRAWAKTDADRPPVFLPTTAMVAPEFDQPADAVSTDLAGLKIEAIGQ
jgi:hypothetical protein